MRTALLAAIFLCPCTLAAQPALDPLIRPGDTCESLRAAYGTETKLEGAAHTWKRDGMQIMVLVKPGGPCVAGSVQYSLEPGRTFRTRDGLVLGKDTIADANLKLKGRINSTSFYFVRGQGKAYAMLVVPPSSGFPLKSTYGWLLNPAIESRLHAPPQLADFTSEPVTFYSLDKLDPRETQ
jgi:hypothetical protein